MTAAPVQVKATMENEPPDADYAPIADYGIVGNCRSAALISRAGSIEWFCAPRFDSPSFFGAILDQRQGGRFMIAPVGNAKITRQYLPHTNVLETTFETSEGTLRLTDCMPVMEGVPNTLWPDHEILRRVECLAGRVEVQVECEPRLSYAKSAARIISISRGHMIPAPGGISFVASDLRLSARDNRAALLGRETLNAGETRWVSLTFCDLAPPVIMPLGDAAQHRLDQTAAWWRRWADRCAYTGRFREQVIRSALTLKLLTFAPSGAIVAAPTTSLPEWIGGVRNWDYRFCWPRDAFMTLRALLDVGYREEGQAFLSWMIHATRMTRPRLHALYDIHGESRMLERTLDHLEGYCRSKPVRIGNAAKDQLQLDAYGAVADAAFHFVKHGGELLASSGRMLSELGQTVCRLWRDPDQGIWEIRSGARHHTLSKAMCWVTLDRLLQLHERHQLKVPVEQFQKERQLIRQAVEEHGYNSQMKTYVSEFGGDQVDASLLLLPLYGFVDAGCERMRRTHECIVQKLGTDGFLYRYRPLERDDGLPGTEGTFTLCGFWNVECLALQGRADEAIDAFHGMFDAANDLGLFSEEYDPAAGRMLGNFPQAFAHVGVIGAAGAIDQSYTPRQARGKKA